MKHAPRESVDECQDDLRRTAQGRRQDDRHDRVETDERERKVTVSASLNQSVAMDSAYHTSRVSPEYVKILQDQ